jgi:hypothetical protein
MNSPAEAKQMEPEGKQPGKCPVRLQLTDRDLLEISEALLFRRKDLQKVIDAHRSISPHANDDQDLALLRQHAKRLGLLSREFHGEYSDRRLSRQEQAGGGS